jgi:hypothetical protein
VTGHAERQQLAVERAASLGHVVVVHPHDAGPRIGILAKLAGVRLLKSDNVQRGQAYVLPPEQAKEWR